MFCLRKSHAPLAQAGSPMSFSMNKTETDFGISRLSFYRIFSSRLSFYLFFLQIIEYLRVNIENLLNSEKNSSKSMRKTLILSKNSENLREMCNFFQNFERCLKRILQIVAVPKCENLVDLEKIEC